MKNNSPDLLLNMEIYKGKLNVFVVHVNKKTFSYTKIKY